MKPTNEEMLEVVNALNTFSKTTDIPYEKFASAIEALLIEIENSGQRVCFDCWGYYFN